MKKFDVILPCRRVTADVTVSGGKDILRLTAFNEIYLHEDELYIPAMWNDLVIDEGKQVVLSGVWNTTETIENDIFLKEQAHSIYLQYIGEKGAEGNVLVIQEGPVDAFRGRLRRVSELDGLHYLRDFTSPFLSTLNNMPLAAYEDVPLSVWREVMLSELEDVPLRELDDAKWSKYDDWTMEEIDYIFFD